MSEDEPVSPAERHAYRGVKPLYNKHDIAIQSLGIILEKNSNQISQIENALASIPDKNDVVWSKIHHLPTALTIYLSVALPLLLWVCGTLVVMFGDRLRWWGHSGF